MHVICVYLSTRLPLIKTRVHLQSNFGHHITINYQVALSKADPQRLELLLQVYALRALLDIIYCRSLSKGAAE